MAMSFQECFDKGLRAFDEGHWLQSHDLLSQAIQIKSTDQEAYLARALVRKELRDYQGAYDDCRIVVTLTPQWWVGHYYCGLMLEAADGDAADALVYFGNALRFQENAQVLSARADTYSRAGNFEQALVDINRAIELEPKESLYWADRGEFHLRAGHLDDADVDCEQALVLNPDNQLALWTLGRTQMERFAAPSMTLGFIARALDCFDDEQHESGHLWCSRALVVEPGNLLAVSLRGRCLFELRRRDEALEHFEHVLEHEPDDFDALYYSALSLYFISEEEKAVLRYTETLRVVAAQGQASDSLVAEIYANRALARVAADDDEGALEDYGQALELDPSNFSYLFERAELHNRLACYEEALSDLHEALTLEPSNFKALLQEMYALGGLHRWEECARSCSYAASEEPESPYPYMNRGLCYLELGKFDLAIIDLTKGLELANVDDMPENGLAEMHRNLALCYKAKKELESANLHFRKARQLFASAGDHTQADQCRYELDSMSAMRAKADGGKPVKVFRYSRPESNFNTTYNL